MDTEWELVVWQRWIPTGYFYASLSVEEGFIGNAASEFRVNGNAASEPPMGGSAPVKAGGRQPRSFTRPDKKVHPARVGTVGVAASAFHVVERFGGVRSLMRALAASGTPKDPACIYRWLYPTPQGTGGRIPRLAWIDVQAAAKRAKIPLTGIRTVRVRKNWRKREKSKKGGES